MMPFELVIYLCIGMVLMIGVFAMDWFCNDQITGNTISMGLLMTLFWPLGLVCLIGAGLAIICDGNFVIVRRKK